jgi:hypothetical protein
MSSTPVFIGVIKTWRGRVSTANTTPDASVTTGLVSIATGAVSGTRIERVRAVHAPAAATTANTAGMVRLYHKTGSTYTLIQELTMAAVTRSASVKGAENEWSRADGQPVVVLASGDELVAGTQVAEPYDVAATGGDL